MKRQFDSLLRYGVTLGIGFLVGGWLAVATPSVFAQEETVPKNLTASVVAQSPRSLPAVSRSECFPFERLPVTLRPKAEALLLQMMDSEALFTLIGSMKPMSSGFERYRLNIETPDITALDEARQILAQFRCGEFYFAEVLPFHRLDKTTRHFEAALFNRVAVRRTIEQHASFFYPLGITPHTDPFAVSLIMEHNPTSARDRGLGYLFGYPDYAVDFFVAGSESYKKDQQLVPRRFINLPVFSSPTGRFVYAVPKDHVDNAEDTQLREKAERILKAYRERREKYIGDGKPGALALLRDWLDDGTGKCHIENARF